MGGWVGGSSARCGGELQHHELLRCEAILSTAPKPPPLQVPVHGGEGDGQGVGQAAALQGRAPAPHPERRGRRRAGCKLLPALGALPCMRRMAHRGCLSSLQTPTLALHHPPCRLCGAGRRRGQGRRQRRRLHLWCARPAGTMPPARLGNVLSWLLPAGGRLVYKGSARRLEQQPSCSAAFRQMLACASPSTAGGKFKDEAAALKLKHEAAGVVGFANSGASCCQGGWGCSTARGHGSGRGCLALRLPRARCRSLHPLACHVPAPLRLHPAPSTQASTATRASFTSRWRPRRSATASTW